MDILNGFQLVANVGEATIIAVVCMGLTNLIKKTPLPNWTMPIWSMVVGAIAGIAIGFIFKDTNIANSGLYGFLVGGFASGVFQFVKAGVNNNGDAEKVSDGKGSVTNTITPKQSENVLQVKSDANTDKLQSKTVMTNVPQQIK
jgi:hypothetical protein